MLFLFFTRLEWEQWWTGESEGSGITWWDWGGSESEKWTAWTLNGKVNEWWFRLVLVIAIKLVCLIFPSLQCLHAHPMSRGQVLCLPLARHAGWVRDISSYKATHIVIVRRTQMAGLVLSLSLFGHLIDWTMAPELAGGLHCRAGCRCLLCL